ncbi:MAG: hypothetical protein DHS20C01_08670 [marine bacterium B5-7]|nr:MAG: hypothetical protein DHS20C01_08670 [marine bacterium B5-7]
MATLVPVLLGLSLFTTTANALGPLDGEVGVTWWSHDIDDGGNNIDADGTGIYGELWWADGWGVAGQYFESDPGRGFGTASDFSIDLKRRLISPTDNTFLAIGLGWQNAEFLGGEDTDGVRLLAEGRVGLGLFFVYGEAAFMPSMSNAGGRRDIDGSEYEAGVSLTPFPFLNLRLGYRVFNLDYRGGSEDSDGYYLGGAFHF